jgi:hypothetical protein
VITVRQRQLHLPIQLELDSIQQVESFRYFNHEIIDFLLQIGNVYFATRDDSRVRKVATGSTGRITTIAGNGTASYSGDNGPATSATLYGPADVALDLSGSSTASHYERVNRILVN